MDSSNLKRTPLYALHGELGAKIVPFAGYEMPVQYPMGIKQEHLHTRDKAGLFDVSHMGQVVVSGANATLLLEGLISVDLAGLAVNHQTYGLFTNDTGGILDDLIISRWGDDEFYLVVNAACKEQDMKHLQQHLEGLDINFLDDRALLAIQGPAAKDVIAQVAEESAQLVFMSSMAITLLGVECFVSRSGYTGEDGFEISVPNSHADALARHLLSFEAVEAIGLGARDTLRLEAGLCLYGHDMDETTTAVEAGLAWSISKSRRANGNNAGGFPGSDIILGQMTEGKKRQRVGLLIEGRRPIREGLEVFDEQGSLVGTVTSGGFSPSLDVPIAMALIDSRYAEIGTKLHAMVRDKSIPVSVVKMPFVPQRYFRG